MSWKKYAFLGCLAGLAIFWMCRGEFHRSFYCSIPIERLSFYQIPCTSIEIEEQKYQVEIDLGAKSALALHHEVLKSIKKQPQGRSRRIDFQGNLYETATYSIPKVTIGSWTLQNITAKEESMDFTLKGSIVQGTDENPNAGRIGRDFFLNKSLLLDFPHLKFIVCDRFEEIAKKGYSIESAHAVPFQNTPDGIVLKIDIDMGRYRFAIDTGSTISVIRSSDSQEKSAEKKYGLDVVKTSQFTIGNTDFGARDLYLLNLSKEFKEIDGLLGMDFLQQHAIYLDFNKNIAYIW